MQKTMWCVRLAILFAFTGIVNAQQLTAEGQDAFARGVVAARNEAWDLAIEQFRIANFSGPREMRFRHPLVLQNMGLAYSRAGDEIPAIIYLEMYLVISPTASNASSVRNEIRDLEVRAEAKALKIFRDIVNVVLDARDTQWQAVHTIAIQKADTCRVLRTVASDLARLGRPYDASATASLASCPSPDVDWRSLASARMPWSKYFAPDFYSEKRYENVAHRAWLAMLENTQFTSAANDNHITGTTQYILKSKGVLLADVPYYLYGVPGSLANWLPQIKELRRLIDGAAREQWQKAR